MSTTFGGLAFAVIISPHQQKSTANEMRPCFAICRSARLVAEVETEPGVAAAVGAIATVAWAVAAIAVVAVPAVTVIVGQGRSDGNQRQGEQGRQGDNDASHDSLLC